MEKENKLKNILIIDGADNCAYDIFMAEDELYDLIFPGEGQNIEFIDDLKERSKDRDHLDSLFEKLWSCPVRKDRVEGIHGILFYELENKKEFYPNKKDSDLDGWGRAFSVAELK
jgi:hypothetical protein